MNKKDQLLAETLGGDGERFARLAAAHARRRRTARQVGLSAGVSCTLAALFLLTRSPGDAPISPAPPSVGPIPAVEIISDAELLAQLKGQPILVLKDQTGITGIIFLAKEAKL